MVNTRNIGVIGTGRLGLSFALLCATKGYNVYAHDIRQDYIDSLSNRTYTTSEPYIEQLMRETTRCTYTTNLQRVIQACDMLFCFVATPSLSDGSYDHSAIDAITDHITDIDISGKTFVIGCTVMPGYTATVADKLSPYGCHVAYNPEFIAQGDIVNGLRTADMVLMGVSDEPTEHALTAIYRTIMDKEPVINSMSPTAAEITKISINCYLTMKIAYANMIGEIAINSGVEQEVSTILSAIGSDSRIGNKYLRYGFGYGGPCLPRDMRALGIHTQSVGIYPHLPEVVDHMNDSHSAYLMNHYTGKNPDNLPYLFKQLTYKAGTDMLIESQQYRLCKDLLQTGYSVDITESPAVIAQVQQELSVYGDKVTYGIVTNGITIDI